MKAGKLASEHIAFLTIASCGGSLKTYPSIFVKESGIESWVAFSLGSFMAFVFYILFLSFLKKNDYKNILDIYREKLGKFTFKVVSCVLIIFYISIAITGSALFGSTAHVSLLFETPIWLISIFCIVPAAYITKKGRYVIGLFALVFIVAISISGCNLALLTHSNKDFSRLLPIFGDGIPKGFWFCTFSVFATYVQMIVITVFTDLVEKNDKIKSRSIIASIFLIQLEIYGIIGVIATYGPIKSVNLYYPKLSQTQVIQLTTFSIVFLCCIICCFKKKKPLCKNQEA